jgi:signal peptidase I
MLMTIICYMAGLRVLLSRLAAGLAFFVLAGCSTINPAAPQSTIPRDRAISLAQQTAALVGGSVFTIAPTGSMKPTLDENSVVAIEKVAFSHLRRGDIVVYRSAAGLPIIHRLHAQVNHRWLVFGDNNEAVDAEVLTETNFLGRVCAIFYTTPGAESSVSAALAQR